MTAAHDWLRLHNAMMNSFKLADYTFRNHLTLSKWQQHGSVADNIVGFSEQYTTCADIDTNEVLFRFLNGLKLSI